MNNIWLKRKRETETVTEKVDKNTMEPEKRWEQLLKKSTQSQR